MKFKKVNVEITNICNLQCSFCPEIVRSKDRMSFELLNRVLDQIAPLTELVCFHLMGEPLSHPELKKFLDLSHNKKVKIFLVSNGVLIPRQEAGLLLHPALYQVNLSIHSYLDNFKSKDPDRYLDGIFKFIDEALAKRPDLYINLRLWNLQSTKDSPEVQMLKKIESRFNWKFEPKKSGRTLHKSYRIKNRLYLHLDTEFIWPSLDLPVLGQSGTCKGLVDHFGILVDGTVVPCCLDKEGKISLGNIQNQPILEILESPRAVKILKGFREKRLEEELCQRCQYIERFS